MSVQAITAALAIQGVSPSEKLLLIVLANYADERMECWPSHSRLATNTCMSQRNILRLFAALEKRGLLTRRSRFRGKLRTSDLIRLYFGGDAMSPYGDTVSGVVGTPCRQGGDTVSPKPKKNLQFKPSTPPVSLTPLSSVASPSAGREEPNAEERAKVARMMRDLADSMRRKTG